MSPRRGTWTRSTSASSGSRCSAAGSPPRSSAPRSTWPPTRPATPPGRPSGSTAASPNQRPERQPMSWDFTVEPEFQELLDWTGEFVTDQVYPLDLLWPRDNYLPRAQLTQRQRDVIDPLKEEVRKRGLWACHLSPELGGQGYGQLKLAMLNEILGKSIWGPRIC